jgi:hypothetical protein
VRASNGDASTSTMDQKQMSKARFTRRNRGTRQAWRSDRAFDFGDPDHAHVFRRLELADCLFEPDTFAGEFGAAESTVDRLKCVPSSAETGFWWCDLTVDQRPADAYSLFYDSAPLEG